MLYLLLFSQPSQVQLVVNAANIDQKPVCSYFVRTREINSLKQRTGLF